MNKERPDKDVTLSILKTLKGNTKFWRELFPRLTTDAFVYQSNHYLANCSMSRKNTTYDEVAVNVILPEALERIKELEAVVDRLIANSLAPKYCDDCNCGKAEGCGR